MDDSTFMTEDILAWLRLFSCLLLVHPNSLKEPMATNVLASKVPFKVHIETHVNVTTQHMEGYIFLCMDPFTHSDRWR
jgi:hypothetical protein